MSDKITAQDFIRQNINLEKELVFGCLDLGNVEFLMIEFAKVHAELCSKACEKVGNDFEGHKEMNDAISLAYPLTNIV